MSIITLPCSHWRMLRKLAIARRPQTFLAIRSYTRADGLVLAQLLSMGLIEPVAPDKFVLAAGGQEAQQLGEVDFDNYRKARIAVPKTLENKLRAEHMGKTPPARKGGRRPALTA